MRLFIGMCVAILVVGCQSNKSVQAPQRALTQEQAIHAAHKVLGESAAPKSTPSNARENLGTGRRTLKVRVAESEVIVVATFVDSARAKPKQARDAAEMLWRFRAVRILKGKLDKEIITIQHPGAWVGVSVDEIAGKEWILLLSSEYMAGKHPYAGLYNTKFEPEIRAILQVQMPQR